MANPETLPHLVARRRKVWAQDELALKAAAFEAAMCVGDLIKGDALGNARSDSAGCQ
jgi:hypothetical protein